MMSWISLHRARRDLTRQRSTYCEAPAKQQETKHAVTALDHPCNLTFEF
jgi:hypothetical protein